ncbi:flagellin [Asticcacaulis sp. ZE23SCel15]|uniref:flagellin n=1 Tax=Asticcacaulis sp. ZE23SCel15 TaxID=3059027 RepID=UPI00265F4DDE|nr:flagellin [Asticcacaulis sp. ZE23SCel15]WKL56453.1 flagellin [Asticcacaulis sp. ZE23SCel15]
MSVVTANTNTGAMAALQALNATARRVHEVESRITTGLKVATAKDNGAVYAIAVMQRSEVSSLDVLQRSLERASSVIDVAMSAGETVADVLNEMKTRVISAADTSLDTTARTTMSEDFMDLIRQIWHAVKNAEFDGTNLIDEGADDMVVPVSLTQDTITVQAQNLSLGVDGLWWNMPIASATLPFTTATEAADFIPAMDIAIQRVSLRLSALGSAAKAIDGQSQFLYKLQDAMTEGVGNLVDADMAKESARMTSVQTRLSLGQQSLSIANRAPSMILGLFQ